MMQIGRTHGRQWVNFKISTRWHRHNHNDNNNNVDDDLSARFMCVYVYILIGLSHERAFNVLFHKIFIVLSSRKK